MSENPASGTAPAADTTTPAKPGRPNVKAWLYGYVAFYVLMFIVYFSVLASRSETLAPEAWLERAGATGLLDGWDGRLGSADGPDQTELKELHDRRRVEVAPPGPPSTAEVRFIEPYSFVMPDGTRRTFEDGQRLTRSDVVALAHAIEADFERGRQDPNHKGLASMVVYRDTYLNGLDWNYILTLGNLAGFLLLVYLFLWGPLRGMLDGMVSKTTQALERAHGAQAEAEELRRRYAALQEELDAKREQSEKIVVEDVAAERERLLAAARQEAAQMKVHLQASLEAEIHHARERIKNEVVREALAEARKLLEASAGEEDHHAAVAAFVSDVEKVNL